MKCKNVRLYNFQGQPVKKLLLFQQRASINQESKQANQDWKHAIESPQPGFCSTCQNKGNTNTKQTGQPQNKQNQQTKKSESQVKICCRNYYRPSSQIPLTSSASSSASASASLASLTVYCKSCAPDARASFISHQGMDWPGPCCRDDSKGEQAAKPYYS